MDRRYFVQLSATAALSVLFNELTFAAGNNSLLTAPDEVWAQTGQQWVQLKSSGGNIFVYQDLEVSLTTGNDSTGVDIQSPKMALSAIRLKWKYPSATATNILGDAWERSYGDLGWKAPDPQIKNPWYVVLNNGRDTACFGVKTGGNAMCWWAVTRSNIELTLDMQSGGLGVQLGPRKLHAADLVTTKNTAAENPFSTVRRFCKIMCETPRLPKQPVYGINDWYFAYGNNSAALIKETTAIMAGLVTDTANKPFSVIDAGWAQYSPLLPGDAGWNEDFSKPNDKFKDMQQLAGDIKGLGMRPGLWMRPLCARHNEKASLLAPKITGRDDPKSPVLDPTIPENLERIKNYFSVYKKWGFEMVKHDFSTYDITGRWGFEMKDAITPQGWRFYDNTRTNAEIIKQLYHDIREAAGDNIYVIGCNTVSHLSAGLFELNRIGDDTSGKEWARTRKMGVNTLGFRMAQHNNFYAVDGDCVGLTTEISWSRNRQWMQLLAESSAPLFISAQPAALGAEQKAVIRESFAKAAKAQPVGEPLDWLNNPLPAKWKLNGSEVNFDWS